MVSNKFKRIFAILIIGISIAVMGIICEDVRNPNYINIGGDPIDIIEPDDIGNCKKIRI